MGYAVPTIWRTHDRAGRAVALTDSGVAHILDRRPEMAPYFEDLREVVAAADRVTRDVDYPRREIHYRQRPSGRRWLRVVVNYLPVPPQGTWTGDVITAHFVKAIPSEETQLWP